MGNPADERWGVRVRRLNGEGVRRGGELVLYWMQTSHRPDDSAALAYAIERANELGLPCVVYEALRPDYPFASDRFHTFVLESACDVAEGLARRGVHHAFFLPRRPAEARGVLARVGERAAMIVTDDFPSFIVPGQSSALARRVGCSMVAVDDCAAVPLALFPKLEHAARTIRPKIAKVQGEWLRPLDEPQPAVSPPARLDLPFDPVRLDRAAIPGLVASCDIDHGVPPVSELPGGAVAAAERALRFVQRRLDAYHLDRNDPSRGGGSGLSPYLHFGAISTRRVALLAADPDLSRGGAGRDAFLEQLVVRRTLAYNFAVHQPRHGDYEALPAWARQTLEEEARDRRSEVTLEDLVAARSPDELWNAAQIELLARGTVHAYARMLWGKLPIAWMQRPADVHAALVYLNDRFALDGRDPDGYAGIGWCFGLHDRPWPRRRVFGAVRPMSSRSARSKIDFEGYVEGWNARRREAALGG